MSSDDASPNTTTEWWRVDTATLHARKQELEVLKRQLDAEQNAILAKSIPAGSVAARVIRRWRG